MSERPSSHNPLNVIALISGGKDSFFSLLHCLYLGHNVVALANLAPTNRTDAELDPNSHMYQTAGHSLIDLYHQALSIPLYRGGIRGSAIDYEKEYSAQEPSEGLLDETEDLIPLLRKVLQAHPTANALSTGAILSTYQRSRVESICLRLGLISVAFLWQYPYLPCPRPSPSSELDNIAAVGLDARIVKVASGGLDETFLWQSLADEKVRKRVEKAVGRFGGSVLGEGGEYETIVVDGPRPLWKRALNIDDDIMYVQSGEGGEAFLAFRQNPNDPAYQFLQKDENNEQPLKNLEDWLYKIEIPDLWDDMFKALLNDDHPKQIALDTHEAPNLATWHATRHIASDESNLTISNLTYSSSVVDAGTQMEKMRLILEDILHSHGSKADDLVSTTIILRSMTDFSKVNCAYGKLFTKPCPPARVTVACGDMMPQDTLVMLSAIVNKRARDLRKGLHVQSRSYWAPANIGPYSQAISIDYGEGNAKSITYIAGQIPLVPATMELLSPEVADSPQITFLKQALLSLQHLWRIGIEMGVTWWPGAVAFVARGEDFSQRALICYSLWGKLTTVNQKDGKSSDTDSDTEEASDIWDRKYGNDKSYATSDDSRRPLPDFARMKRSDSPGFLAVEVSKLPRGSQVEWQSAGLTGDGLESVSSHSQSESTSTSTNEVGTEQLITRCSLCSSSSVMFVELPVLPNVLSLSSLLGFERSSSGLTATAGTIYTAQPELFGDVPLQVVPCRRVLGSRGRELAAGLVVYLGL